MIPSSRTIVPPSPTTSDSAAPSWPGTARTITDSLEASAETAPTPSTSEIGASAKVTAPVAIARLKRPLTIPPTPLLGHDRRWVRHSLPAGQATRYSRRFNARLFVVDFGIGRSRAALEGENRGPQQGEERSRSGPAIRCSTPGRSLNSDMSGPISTAVGKAVKDQARRGLAPSTAIALLA